MRGAQYIAFRTGKAVRVQYSSSQMLCNGEYVIFVFNTFAKKKDR
jgi:hypothetical protein